MESQLGLSFIPSVLLCTSIITSVVVGRCEDRRAFWLLSHGAALTRLEGEAASRGRRENVVLKVVGSQSWARDRYDRNY